MTLINYEKEKKVESFQAFHPRCNERMFSLWDDELLAVGGFRKLIAIVHLRPLLGHLAVKFRQVTFHDERAGTQLRVPSVAGFLVHLAWNFERDVVSVRRIADVFREIERERGVFDPNRHEVAVERLTIHELVFRKRLFQNVGSRNTSERNGEQLSIVGTQLLHRLVVLLFVDFGLRSVPVSPEVLALDLFLRGTHNILGDFAIEDETPAVALARDLLSDLVFIEGSLTDDESARLGGHSVLRVLPEIESKLFLLELESYEEQPLLSKLGCVRKNRGHVRLRLFH